MKNIGFRDRLEELIGDEAPFGWAGRVGISKGAFTRIWNEGTMPKVEHLQKIKRHTGASMDWLIDGEGPPPDCVLDIQGLIADASIAFAKEDMDEWYRIQDSIKEVRAAYSSGGTATDNADASSISDNFVLVPRHDVVVSGGAGSSITSEQIVDYFAFNKMWLKKRGLQKKNLVLVEVVGESMQPVLSNGDTVLVDMSHTELKTGAAYVIRIGDELLVKYAQRLPGNLIKISSENRHAYPSFEINLNDLGDEVAVIGRVVNSSRNW